MERKLATVLFADLVGSTQLLDGQDPEITRRRVTSFFDGVQRCIETHGGTVEKFAGDAVMAAFGIPIAHEDDADRAVRAGLGILDHVLELGLEARVGIEAGEVVVDETDSTFATGEAVNVAARLQQAAAPGEILMGESAQRLTVGRIEAESAGPLELRGFRNPIAAYRAIAVRDGQPHAKVSAPFVGRLSELDLLENTLARTIRDRRPHVFTVYGEPGVGKSRLIREFLAGVEGTTILSGRALPYGEGVTYWPLAEMVKSAAGITDDDPMETAKQKLIECCGDEAIAELLGLASGVMEAVEGERGAPEIAWAAREFADELADVQPLIMVFEDIHWAEEPLLELIDHLAQWVGLLLAGTLEPASEVVAAPPRGRRRLPSGRARLRAAVACLIVGAGLVMLADGAWAHAVGVAALFAFGVLGAAILMPPDVLAGPTEDGRTVQR